jgi:hypothetical protein
MSAIVLSVALGGLVPPTTAHHAHTSAGTGPAAAATRPGTGSWLDHLRDDPVPWLLAPDTPADLTP